jgi:site-specific recombinase XerD
MRQKPVETLTQVEQSQLTESLIQPRGTQTEQMRGMRNFTMIILMLDAGLRVGEVVQLQQSDLVFEGKPFHALRIRVEISKSKVERTVPLTSRLQDAIRTMHTCWWNQPGMNPGIYAFFCTQNTRHLTVRQAHRIVGTASLKAIKREIHPHVLRHTFATRLMRQTNIRVVQELLGHKSLSSTQIYMHPNTEDLTRAIESI